MMIGNESRPLHAVFSNATGKRRRRAAVFCPPFGIEYSRTHRAGRLLAQRLAVSGLDALRFDYFGTGDSAGDDGEFTVPGAVQDALVAVDEAGDLGKVRRVTLIGMREGALVALLAAPLARTVDRLVIWDPVITDIPRTPLPLDVLMLVAADSPGHREVRDRLAALSARLMFEEIGGPPSWEPVGEDGVGVAPVAALARIAGWEP